MRVLYFRREFVGPWYRARTSATLASRWPGIARPSRRERHRHCWWCPTLLSQCSCRGSPEA